MFSKHPMLSDLWASTETFLASKKHTSPIGAQAKPAFLPSASTLTPSSIYLEQKRCWRTSAQELDHYCMVSEAGGLGEILAKVSEFGIEPDQRQSRWAAHGHGEFSYLVTPEDVSVELRHYPDGRNDRK